MMVKMMAAGVISIIMAAGPVLANESYNVDKKVDAMKTELVLTDKQADSVKQILNDYKDTMTQARRDKEQRLSQVLTPDQMNKTKDMKKAWDKD